MVNLVPPGEFIPFSESCQPTQGAMRGTKITSPEAFADIVQTHYEAVQGAKIADQNLEAVLNSDRVRSAEEEGLPEAYIKNLDYGVTAEVLVTFLRQQIINYGILDASRAAGAILKCKIKKDQDGRRHSGFATVIFRSNAILQTFADSSQPWVLNGRRIRIIPSDRNRARAIRFRNHVYDPSESRYVLDSFSLGQYQNEEPNPSNLILWTSNRSRPTVLVISPKERLLAVEFWDIPSFDYDTSGLQQFRMVMQFRHVHGEMGLHADVDTRQIALVFMRSKAPFLYKNSRSESTTSNVLDALLKNVPAAQKDTLTWELDGTAHVDDLWNTEASMMANSSLVGAEWERTIDHTKDNIFGRCNLFTLCFQSRIGSKKTPEDKRLWDELCSLNLLKKTKILPLRIDRDSNAAVNLTRPRFDGTHAGFNGLSFSVRYMLQCLVSAENIYERDINAKLINFLYPQPERLVVEAVEEILMQYQPREWISEPLEVLKQHMHNLEWKAGSKDWYENPVTMDEFGTKCRLVRRVAISPLRVHTFRPEVEVTNRVLREYVDFQDRFLRVHFTDEDFGSILRSETSDIFERLRKMLKKGMYIAGRKFVLLAFSNSQLREHGCWLYAEPPSGLPTKCPRADEIRKWMGKFQMITQIGKYGARLGQCFSNSVGTVKIPKEKICKIEDCWTEDKKYCFSDGVGMMAKTIAKEVCQSMSMTAERPTPSAFQIRFGGCKGMLTVAEDDWLPEPDCVAIRPSQEKFQSDHRELEIVGIAKAMPAYLNRQLIAVLKTLEVPDTSFLKLFDDYVARLDDVLRGERQALGVICSTGMGQTSIKTTGTQPSMASAVEMLRSGFSLIEEPHLQDLVRAWRTRLLLDLRLKARVHVKQAICLYGVMDETKSLRPGEVFVQFRPNPDETEIHRVVSLAGRTVTVCRNPSLHPGDIRVLQAVDAPKLKNLIDVVVFPSYGSRPHASEMSGGDLDGDIFFINFDPSLIPEKVFPPMDYSGAIAKPMKEQGNKMDQLVDFFIDYMKNDNLGQIANAHLAHSDRSMLWTKCQECIELAGLHSTAVDFAKTGVPASFPARLRVREWPDFMEKDHLKSYESRTILGILYRKTLEKIQGGCEVDEIRPREIKPDPDLLIQGREAFIDEAKESYYNYLAELLSIMKRFGVEDEGELISGHVKEFSRKANCGKSPHADVQARLSRQVGDLRHRLWTEFEDHLTSREDWQYMNEQEQKLLRQQKASAWYDVAYEQELEGLNVSIDRQKGTWTECRMLSFPWIAVTVLSGLKRQALRSRKMPDTVVPRMSDFDVLRLDRGKRGER